MIIDVYALSTKDNPINPFDDPIKWKMMDMILGHNCDGVLAREAKISSVMSDVEYHREIGRAIDTIIAHDFLNIGYIKLTSTEEFAPPL